MGGFFDDLFEGITANDIAKGVIGFGTDMFNNSAKDSGRENYVNSLKEAEQNNYDNFMANREAYINHLHNQYAQGQSNAAARNAYAGQVAAGRAAEEERRRKAYKKGMKRRRKGFQKGMDMINPFVQTSKDLLPGMQDAAQTGMNNLSLLQGMMFSPERMGRLNQAQPALNMNIGQIPQTLLGKK